MTKIIHLITLKGRHGKICLSNMELECIESWKRVYPDFEIKLWTDEDCMEWIKTAPFANYFYNDETTGHIAFVSDYLRTKIIYEYGGLYMDTDVYAYKRIPDSYFERPFTAWDAWPEVTRTNNGTCYYAPEPKMPIMAELEECMRNTSFDLKEENGTYAMNRRIDTVLEKHGLDLYAENACERDWDLGDIVVLNRKEFGAKNFATERLENDNKIPYLIHCCSGSWALPTFWKYTNLRYTIVDKNTDLNKLKKKLIEFRKFTTAENNNLIVFLFVDGLIRFDDEMNEVFKSMKNWFTIYYMFHEKQSMRSIVLDLATKRISDVHSCIDFMR